MCGFAGILDYSCQTSEEDLRTVVTSMAAQLKHRGPDDESEWIDAGTGVGLGFRRLSVLDLSPSGRQPMLSHNGRYVIAFNGEIYNFVSLRQELEVLGHVFSGHSDTEVLLASLSEWGVEPAVRRLNGMFAFALWDRRERVLHLVRDRLGEKPLYYYRRGNLLLFGSELKALKAHSHFSGVVDRKALTLYLRYNCVPAPYSIFESVFKLPPACILSFRASSPNGIPSPIPYWAARDIFMEGQASPLRKSTDSIIDELDELLRDSVRLRMLADVPLGAFLSGGTDSSMVVAMMQAQSNLRIKTFAIGFQAKSHDESEDAKRVASHLGTDHTEHFVTPQEALEVIPQLPGIYDEPFADSSQIPTFLVSRLARQRVTVSLSGDGGDELFGGYNRHLWLPKIWQKASWLPPGIRRMTARAINWLSPQVWDRLFARLGVVLPTGTIHRTPGDKIQKFSELLTAEDFPSMYLGAVSHWHNPENLVIGGSEPPIRFTQEVRARAIHNLADEMMYLDAMTYLPDDILVKLDRASMAVSLEARTPFLDHRLIELAWRIPFDMKIRDGHGKWILRQLLRRYVPPGLTERPKSGFALPLDSWLRGPLRQWAEGLLSERRLREEGYFNPAPIRLKWKQHLSGRRNWQFQLWDVLMFEAWLDTNRVWNLQNVSR